MGHGRFVLKFATFAIAFLLIGTSAFADIVPISVTGTVWQVYGNLGNAPTAAPLSSGTSTLNVPVQDGAFAHFNASSVNFSAYNSDALSNFLASGGATSILYSNSLIGTEQMSSCSGSTFSSSTSCYSTVIELTGTYDFLAGTTYTLSHDDGVILFAGGTSTNRLPAGSEDPTVSIGSSWTPSADTNGSFTIWYMATNGNPEVLQLTEQSPTVPDGGVTLMLLGGALVALETLRRKLRV